MNYLKKYRPIIYLFATYIALLVSCIIPMKSGAVLHAQSAATNQSHVIHYKGLVNRLTNLKLLAALPQEGEKSAMWASYDRKSKVDSVSGAFIDWGANNDGLSPQFIRKEGENMVLAEMEGPGAIVRIWSASPAKGHIKIFIDGNPVPVIDLPFIDLFSTSSIPAFNYPQLVYETAARGFNNYVPITYQRSCKVVAEPGWGQYYQFNYITFPAGTTIGTFEAKPTTENANALATANDFFENKLGQVPYSIREREEKKEIIELPPNGSKTITLTGLKAIYALKAKLAFASKQKTHEAYRKVLLQIKWDDEMEPAVWSPIGDFFGSAPGYNLYKTLPMGMTEDAMYSFWYMPFEKSATITLTNHFSEAVKVDLTIGIENGVDDIKNKGRFHAKWHRNLPPLEDSARWPDWTVLETEGRGRFLGMSLLVWNPKGGSCKQYGGEGQHWWGEGDEKFFVDGEKFPSTFGTGTEDYFGYAWCIPKFFEHAFHSQNHTEDNMGYQSMNRWQVIDNIPFQRSFNGYLEKYFPDHWPTQYATVAYWYLNAGGKDPIKPTPVNELFGYENAYTVYREPGAIEGESLQIISNTGGYAGNDLFVDERLFDRVSGHKVFVWHGKPKAQNELETKFQVEKPGTYRLKVGVVKTPDSGRFMLNLNGDVASTIIDLNTNVKPGAPETIELGVFKFEKGDQVLKFKWLESENSGRRMLLDFIKIEAL
jgi:hypothetical protein